MKKEFRFGIVVKILAVTLASMAILVTLSILTMQDIGKLVADQMVESKLNASAYFIAELDTVSAGNADFDMEEIMRKVEEETHVSGILFIGNTLMSTRLTDEDGKTLTEMSIPDDVYRKLQAGEEVFVKNCEIGGINYYGYYVKMAELPTGQPMIAFVVTPSDEINEIYYSIMNARVIFTALATVFAMVLVFAVVWRINRALKVSISDVMRVSEGRLGFAVSDKIISRKDEVGDKH